MPVLILHALLTIMCSPYINIVHGVQAAAPALLLPYAQAACDPALLHALPYIPMPVNCPPPPTNCCASSAVWARKPTLVKQCVVHAHALAAP